MDNEQSQIDPILYREPDEDQQTVITALPDRALNVEAAALALLENDDAAALDKFNSLSALPRNMKPEMLTQEGERHMREFEDYIRSGLVKVLADPTVPIEQKTEVVKQSQSGSFAPPDAQTTLYNKALIADSAGESEKGSKVRESMAMSAFKAAELLEERQGIINAAVGKRDGTLGQVTDFLSMLVPLEAGVTAAKVASKEGGSVALASTLPGTYMRKLSDKFKSMPMEEQNAYLKELATIVSSSSGLTTSKNQLRTEAWLTEISGGMGTSDEMLENFFNLLDIAGVGSTIKALPKSLSKATDSAMAMASRAQAEVSKNAKDWFERTGTDVRMTKQYDPETGSISEDVMGNIGKQEAVPTVPKYNKDVEDATQLEAQAVQLKDTASLKLSRDEFEETRSNLESLKSQKPKLSSSASPAELQSYLEAKKAYQETVQGLTQKLEIHKNAEKAEEVLPDVLKKIETLKNSEALEPVPLNPIAAAIDRAYNQSIMFTHNPRTPGFIINLTNPDKARSIQAQLIINQSDELAQAIHGVNRQEALVKAVAPQLTDTTGRVKKLVDDPELSIRSIMASELGESIKNTHDGFRYTEKEIASARANIVGNYKEVTGLQINDAMTSFTFDGDTIKISGVYTNGQGGWTTSEEAVSQAKFALRDRGVKDSDIQVLKLDGDEFVPVDKDAVAGREGVFAVRLNVEDRITDADVGEWDKLDVKRNFLDRFQTQGAGAGWSRFVFEPNSMLHRRLTGPMSVADDKSTIITNSLLLKFEKFTDAYVKLPKNVKQDVDHYIRDANVHEIAFDRVALANRFPPNVVDMLQEWRDAWDTMYLLENAEVVKAVDKEGYKLFSHPNIEAVVKERPKRFENNVAYDPAIDSVRTLTKTEIDDIYNKGGYVGEFRRPITLNGATSDFMIVRNTPTEYARKLRDNDKLLNYREGYYQVSYRTPKFIDEEYTDSSGVKRTRTIGVAGSVKEAKAAVDRLQSQGNGNTYKYRGDERDVRRGADAYWDMNQVSGRIAQRHRGKLLENTVGFKTYGADDFIENPADSAVRAATSMGGRIAMKEVIDTAKERFMKQFGHMLAGPDYQKKFPTSRDMLMVKGEQSTKELADARTTWEYINYMESGYINGMSEISRRALNTAADALGLRGYKTVENLTRELADANIQGAIKGGVFAAYLATNPLRQWLVQTNQVWRLLGYSGTRMNAVFDLGGSFANPAKATALQKEFQDFYKDTGFVQAISRSNLVRGTLLDAANRQNQVSKAYDKVVQVGRAVGYDIGENINNIMASAAVFDKYKQAGKNVNDKLVRAEMHAEARALNRNMSYAGDMPYNQNSLALAFTYMQVPHKFALQGFDRTIDPKIRARLIAADLALWGLPGVAVLQAIAGNDILPENANVREALTDGLQSFMINKTFQLAYGDATAGIDLSSLAPYDMDSWNKMINGLLFDGGMSTLVSNSPAGRVFGLSADSRLGYAIETTSMFFKDLMEDKMTAVTIKDVADAWARMSSGYTNLQEAKIMYQLGKVIDKQGRTVDDTVTTPEAIAKVFGFGTKATKDYYETILKASEVEKQWQESARADAKLIFQMIRGLNEGDMQGARSVAMLSQALADASNFPSKQAQAQYLATMQAETQKSANFKVIEKLAKVAGYPDPSEGFADLAKTAPLSAEEKSMYMEAMNKNYKFWNELEKANKEK